MKTNDVSPSSIHDLFYEFWNEAMLFDAGDVNEVNSYEKTLNELVSFLINTLVLIFAITKTFWWTVLNPPCVTL